MCVECVEYIDLHFSFSIVFPSLVCRLPCFSPSSEAIKFTSHLDVVFS